MSVTASATSPSMQAQPRQARAATTPSVRSPIGHNMAPILPQQHMSPPAQTPAAKARSPSPNYFGLTTSSSNFPVSTYSGEHARQNWSPPSSAVRSAAAFSPTYIPVDQNPEFAAFRRQSEGLGKSFSLSSLQTYSQETLSISPKSERFPKESDRTSSRDCAPYMDSTPIKYNLDTKAVRSPPQRPGPYVLEQDVATLGRSPKRHLSSDSTNFPAAIRKGSPAASGSGEGSLTGQDITISPIDDLQMPLFGLASPSGQPAKARAETHPGTNGAQILITPHHAMQVLEFNPDSVLLLDLRVSTQYAKSRISGAMNLCVPTTLLKRPSFNVNKLAETFKTREQRSKFENWRSCRYIVVYDSSASQLKDAAICLNTIKKFEGEGYSGHTYIIKGGFAEFSRIYPQLIDKGPETSPSGMPGKLNMSGTLGAPLPVLGGCPIPATKTAVNPFFGNIRQNMDLIGGVGQMAVSMPEGMTQEIKSSLPDWLRWASKSTDQGAQVSDKFLHIEEREQKRMQNALSGEVSYGEAIDAQNRLVQIAGIEKGTKNRYNNIWPFEHSRVKLEDVPNNGCDYVNANHVQSSLSHKRYIATQGPIPATFADFWNMVWQQDVRVIVMLTAEKEGGQIKAHDYWSDHQYGPFRLEQLSSRKATLDPEKIHRHRRRQSGSRKSSMDKPSIARNDSGQETVPPTAAPHNQDEPYITVRRMALSHDSLPFEPMREITQLHYSHWPDFGSPAHPSHLLGLVEQCDSVVRNITHTKVTDPDPPFSRPVLVHCSAGCGRTGTFCTVDSVIDQLKRQRKAIREQPHPLSRKGSEAVTPQTPQSVSRFFDAVPDKAFFSPTQMSSSPIKGPMEDRLAATPDEVDGDWLRKSNLDLVEKTVEDFRNQRLSMVQSLRQFVLCYETVLEWIVEEDRRYKDL